MAAGYGPGVDQPICMIEASGTYAGAYYYHFDGLGSVVALSDADGETVQTYEYSVYGEPAASDPNHPNPFLFTARRFDRETGLYHYRARAYNATIGRFLQTDPAGQGMNWYAYCGNSPVIFTDASGCQYVMPLNEDSLFVSPDVPFWWRQGDWCVKRGRPQYPVIYPYKWTINDFFNWYRFAARWGEDAPLGFEEWGKPVDIGQIGLLEDFTNHYTVKGLIADRQEKVANTAMEFAASFMKKWEEYWAMSYEEKLVADAPPMGDGMTYDVAVDYACAPSPYRQTLAHDTIVVFGKGTLTAHISIGVGLLGSGCVVWNATVKWEIHDAFKDVQGKGSDWTYCRPYKMIGTWCWSVSDYISF